MINPDKFDGNSSLLVAAYLQVPGSWLQSPGPGPGLLLELLALQPEDYLGIDPSGKMLEELKRKFPEHETKKKAAFGMLGDVGDSFLGSFFVEPLQKLEQISKG